MEAQKETPNAVLEAAEAASNVLVPEPTYVVDNMKPELVKAHFKEFIGKPAGKQALDTLVKKIVDEYSRKQKEEGMGLAICSGCNAFTNCELNACPLCGAIEVEDGSDAPTPMAVTGTVTTLALAPKGREEVVEPKPGLTEDDLNAAMKEFQAKQGETAAAYWEMGRMLSRMKSDGLYRLRKLADGKPAYLSFEQFVKAEIGWNRKNAYAAMGVSEKFTPKQIEEIGHSKLALTVNLPDAERARMVSEAGSKTKAEMEQEIAESRANPEEPRSKKVTLQIEDERHIVQLLCSKENKETGEFERAKTLEDKPRGVLETINGVTISFAVVSHPTRGISLIIETARS